MKPSKLIILFCIAALFINYRTFGQANPFINVLPANSGIVAVGDTIDIVVTIGNTGPISTIPQAKLRPIIQIPASVTFLPNAAQVGLPTGWSILTNTGSQLRICNSSDPIPVSTSRVIVLKAKGVTVSPPQTFSGNINFGNGTTCAAGTSVAGDLIADNSATSTLQVTAFSLNVLVDATISCYGMSNGSIQAIPSFQGQTYTYTLNGGAATNTTGFFDMLGPGTYTVCASDGSSSSCNTVVLTEPAQLTASLSILSTVSCLGNDGAISAQVSGGTTNIQPHVLTWSAGVNASSIYATSVNGLSIGTYTVTVEDDNNCFATATIFLPATSPVEVTASASPIVCFGGTTTIIPNATGGTGAKSYSISGGTFTVTAGSYTVTATDVKGCTATTAITITQPAIISTSSSASACDSYTWSANGITYTTSGAYTYTSLNASGCEVIATLSLTITPSSNNTTTIAANNTYTWSVTGQTYTTSGIKIGTTTNCVTELLDLTITQTLFTGPSTLVGPYVLPVATGVTTTSMLTVPETVGGYKMVGIPDGLGAFDNNNGTFTLLMNHELGSTLGAVRAHGSKGAFVSKWIINKSDLSIVSGSDLMTSVYGWNSATQSQNSTPSTFAFQRFCSADLPPVTAYYNPYTGLGTQDRIFMHGEEGGTTGYQVATVASGTDAGKAYILGKFNISTNGSGLTGVGAWENALANPFPQNKTVVVGNNDGGTGIMNNSVCVYQGTKTNSGTAADKAGLTNGTLKFVNVAGNPLEIPATNTTTRATNITSGTAFTLSATSSTTFSRPEDGAWDPTDYSKYYFVTTDRLDQVADGVGTQIGRSRLWRLNFTDITNPDLGGTIDLLLDGTEGQNMMDNMTFDNYGHILLQEDPGGVAHNGKIWQYTIATDQIKMLAKHDPAKFGDIVSGVVQPATLPFTNDEETSGIIDMSAILGAGNFLFVDQAHYLLSDPEAVEGGQLLKLYNPDTYTAAQCATTSSSTQTACDSYTWAANGVTYTTSGTYIYTSLNAAGCLNTDTLYLTVNYKSAGTTSTTACNAYTWTSNGQTYTTSGTYIHTYLNASGCLHTQTLNLSLGYTTYSTLNVTGRGYYQWPTNGNTYTQSGVYTHTLQNASGCDSILNLNLTIIPGVNLSLKALLGGAFDPQTNLMHDSLRNKQLIPLTEVYSFAPFNRSQIFFAGGETVSPSLLSITGPNAIVDWVYIEIRSGSNFNQIVATKRALIERDGDVVDTNGSTNVFLPGFANGQYYISLKHRNHLGIMTTNAITLNQFPALIDFTQPSYPVWVNTAITTNAPRNISGSVAVMIPGDANFNKNVKYNGFLSNDKDAVLTVVGAATLNNIVNGYRSEDVNMDGQVKYNNLNNDRSFIGVQVGIANPNRVLSQHTPN